MLLVKHFVSTSSIHNLGLFIGEAVIKDCPIWRFEPEYDVEIPETILDEFDDTLRHLVLDCAEYFSDRRIYRLGNDADIFMNHSETPNLIDLGDVMIAARDIAVGEELTCDYRKVHVANYRPPGERVLEIPPP
ncbi:hypothetical protein LX81_03932 [Palleronia aestuarii]|uniref:SET domain-containing protein n=1 Tax=Palleronia aestuarii TaxID=568105 RepID=A0A2W7MZ49_9RHOB|nr:SET domain-containing protein [Palleronia aestuarii]PZX11427.1 hypothetical protein LX81_03932 [Palleronia aestuarii]